MLKRFASLLLAIIIMMSYSPFVLAADESTNGSCGSNLSWSLVNGELTVTGTGDMTDYHFGTAPWQQHITEIQSIVIGEGVTSVGDYAFYNCWLAEKVSLPDSMTSIGNMAFGCCENIESIVFPKGIERIDTMAFASCSALTEIYFCGDAPTISEDAFLYLSGTIYYPIGNETWSGDVISACGGNFTLVEYCVEHVSVLDPAITPTCTEPGLTQGAHCSVCGDILIEQLPVPENGHTEVTDAPVDPTCTTHGFTEGAHCSVCNTILIEQKIIPAEGHDYSRTVTEPTCTKEGYITHNCSRCGHTYTSNHTEPLGHTPVIDPAVTPTCTSTGLTEGSHCSKCNEILDTQTDLPMAEHSWDEGITTVEPTYESTGKMVYTCLSCGGTTTKIIPELGHVHQYTVEVTKPTCTQPGYTTFTCSCGESYTDEPVQALGHTPLDPVHEIVSNAGCETDGSYDIVVYCSVCTEELSRTSAAIPAIGHSVAALPAVAATCTESGLTEGSSCTVCGEVFSTQEVIAPTGHTLVKDIAVSATCTESGTTAGAHCFVCGKVLIAQQVIPAPGHSHGDPVIENSVPAEGQYDSVVYCTVCGTEISRETMVGSTHEHTPGEPVTENETTPTCTTAGSYEKVIYCTECSAEISRTQCPIETTGHIPDTPVVENKVNAGELTEGSYDSVVYCTVCETELSRETKIIPATGIDPLTITRIAGSGRCETAIQAADTLKQELSVDKFETIIMASGNNFADALAGSYLAAVKSAPILLYRADKTELNQDYILANLSDGGTVYLLGGSVAVPEAVEITLTNAGIHTVRLAGSDRYATCIEILKEADITPGQEILVATGRNFADSLSASATGLPILLVNGGQNGLMDIQRSFLDEHSGGKLTILGGTAAIGEALETQLAQYGETKRLAGTTRYDTSVAIAETYFKNVDTAFIAYGKNFPDGLCGGPVAYLMKAPLLLTAENEEATASTYITKQALKAGYVLGGTAVISDEMVNRVFYAD